jgi:hypothetical protein
VPREAGRVLISETAARWSSKVCPRELMEQMQPSKVLIWVSSGSVSVNLVLFTWVMRCQTCLVPLPL